jgi:hypothetical protein
LIESRVSSDVSQELLLLRDLGTWEIYALDWQTQ